MLLKLILQAAKIPEGSVVTKIRGQKEYVIRDKIIVYGEEGIRREMVAKGGARFLANPTGDLNAVNGDVELVWLLEVWELDRFLEEL